MARTVGHAPHKTLTLLFLLWIGFDLGAHGIFASDFEPVAGGGAYSRLSVDDGGGAATDAPDHCFCHGVSIGAVDSAPGASLIPSGTLVIDQCPQAPLSDAHRLDRPPQLPA